MLAATCGRSRLKCELWMDWAGVMNAGPNRVERE